ncbi:MAG: hypothetical protein KGZ39_06240 [Simkania sp.]|nr:hypothetical protein [Simkania sp.]
MSDPARRVGATGAQFHSTSAPERSRMSGETARTHQAAFPGGGSFRVSNPKGAVEDGYEVTMRPAPSTVHLGTSTKASFRAKEVSDKNQTAMEGDFNTIQRMLKKIPAYRDMKYLSIDLNHGLFTIHMPDGTDITKGRPEIKQELRQALQRSEHPDKIAAHIEELDLALIRFRSIAAQEGVRHVWPHAIRGESTRGNFVGARALQHNHPIIQRKQCESLKYGQEQIKALLAKVPAAERPRAVERVLKAEAFLIKMKENLTNELQRIEAALPTAKKGDIAKLKHKQESYLKLLDQVQKDTARYALYCAAIFKDPEECYNAVCQEMYREAYAGQPHRPSFADFMVSMDSAPLREYAADVASSLIADPTQYHIFCKDHEISPKQDHVNTFLIQGLHSKSGRINYNTISIGFSAEEKRDLAAGVQATRTWAERAVQARLQVVDPTRTLSPEKRMEAALNQKGWGDLFEDPQVSSNMFTTPRTGWQKAVAYPLYPVTAAVQGIKGLWKKKRP